MRLTRILSNIIFPELCIICKRSYTIDGEQLCMTCLSSLPFTDHYKYPQNEFIQHFWGRIPILSGAALLSYSAESGVRNILHRLKYQDDENIGVSMGRLMAIHYKSYFSDLDAIVPVPLHRDKKILRGYNQCESIARGIQEKWNLPIWDDVAIRTQSTDTQTHKTRAERAESMMSSFDYAKPEKYRDQHILIIDDVMTTGATLEGCAAALLRGTSVKISMMTLAMGHY